MALLYLARTTSSRRGAKTLFGALRVRMLTNELSSMRPMGARP